MVLRNVVIGMSASALLPRRQPTTAPPTVPIAKEKIVATPTSPIVHGSAPLTTSVTGRSPWSSEIPRSPCASSTQ
ncbi:hypothetical protein GCM10027067_34000 [Pseudactinotalea suaedae]